MNDEPSFQVNRVFIMLIVIPTNQPNKTNMHPGEEGLKLTNVNFVTKCIALLLLLLLRHVIISISLSNIDVSSNKKIISLKDMIV